MKKEYTSVDFLQSRFFGIPEGLKIPFDRSGKAEYEKLPHCTVTFYKQKKTPKKDNLSKRSFDKKRIKGTRRRRSKPVSPPWQREMEDEYCRTFIESKLIFLVLHSVLC